MSIKFNSREKFYTKLESLEGDFKDFIGKEIKVYSRIDVFSQYCGIITEIKFIAKGLDRGFKAYFRIKILRENGETNVIIAMKDNFNLQDHPLLNYEII